jgi:hypothetical protein
MRKKKLVAQLWETVYAKRVWQEQPWTMVKFRVKIPPGKGNGTDSIETFGFSKANWPDQWDDEYGIFLAEKKAMARAARIILEKWG